MKSTKEGYEFVSLALLHTTNCVKESEETERLWAGGCKVRQTVRQPERKKRKAGRWRERAAGRETRQEKKRRWLVASCYSMMISCLAMLSQILTNIDCCWITCPVIIQGLLGDQKMPVKNNAHKPLCMGYNCLWVFTASHSLPACVVLSLLTCLSVCFSVCHLFICFVLLSVLP